MSVYIPLPGPRGPTGQSGSSLYGQNYDIITPTNMSQTLGVTDYNSNIAVNTINTPYTITLPPISSVPVGTWFNISKQPFLLGNQLTVSQNPLTISTSGTDQIYGSITSSNGNNQTVGTTFVRSNAYDSSTMIISNSGTNWRISGVAYGWNAPNYVFYFYENTDQNGVTSPSSNGNIMTIPYNTNWNGQRYLLSTLDNGVYTPVRLTNIKTMSFTVDLTSQRFNTNDNCNFNCYFVASTSSSSPNAAYAPINNTSFVPTANYYDAAGADGGRFGVEFDVFESNSGNVSNGINFYQHTGHLTSGLLAGQNVNTQCITYSSSTPFLTEPANPGSGAPNTNYRTNFTEVQNLINVEVSFANPTTTDPTTISYNGTVVWNSKWLVGGTYAQWPPNTGSGFPCTAIGTLVPFADVTTNTATSNSELMLQTINDANTAGYWLFIGMNPFYCPPTSSYDANHTGAGSADGSGGDINIRDFNVVFW